MATTLRTAAVLFILVATVMSQTVALGGTSLNCSFTTSMIIPVNWTEISGIWYLRNWMSNPSTELDASVAIITDDLPGGLIHYRFNYSRPNTSQECHGPPPLDFDASANTSVVQLGTVFVHTAVFSLVDEKTLAIWEKVKPPKGTLQPQWLYVLTKNPTSDIANMSNSIFQTEDYCTQFDYSQKEEVNASHYNNFECD